MLFVPDEKVSAVSRLHHVSPRGTNAPPEDFRSTYDSEAIDGSIALRRNGLVVLARRDAGVDEVEELRLRSGEGGLVDRVLAHGGLDLLDAGLLAGLEVDVALDAVGQGLCGDAGVAVGKGGPPGHTPVRRCRKEG